MNAFINPYPKLFDFANGLSIHSPWLANKEAATKRAHAVLKLLSIDAINALAENNMVVVVSDSISDLSQYGQLNRLADGRLAVTLDPIMLRAHRLEMPLHQDDAVTSVILTLIEASKIILEKYDGHEVGMDMLSEDEHYRIQLVAATYLFNKGRIKDAHKRASTRTKSVCRMIKLETVARTFRKKLAHKLA